MGKIKKIISLISMVMLILCGTGYCQDKKEEMRQYISKINPVLINIQITSRNISQNIVSLGPAVKQMREYLGQLRAVKPPIFMAKQHKMILLSLQKMKMGFYLLYKGDRVTSVPLVRNGAWLFKIAARDIVNLAAKEGLVKNKNSTPPDGARKIQQDSQARPILPPVVPVSAPMVSPTPSPQITAPQIQQQIINQPPQPSMDQDSQSSTMRNIPSSPAYAIAPNVKTPKNSEGFDKSTAPIKNNTQPQKQ